MTESSLIIYDEPERWTNLIVKGYEDCCMISSYGNIKSIGRHRQMTKYYNRYYPAILRKLGMAKGYYTILLKNNGESQQFQVHRLVAIHFIPNPLNLEMVNHKDCNKLNNYYKNLEWCTRKQNYDHAVANGRYTRIFLNKRVKI